MAKKRKLASADGRDFANDEAAPDSPPEHAPDTEPSSSQSSLVGSTAEARATALTQQLSPLYIPHTLPSLEAHYDTLYEMLEKSVTSHHNNACLLTGFSGTGKSSLVRKVLQSLTLHCQSHSRHFVTVYLNGQYYSDDTSALREIVYQLSIDYELEKPRDNADFQTLFDYLLSMLTTSRYSSTPIFFVLDFFDCFADRPNERQSLLYNLCDLLQASKCQLAIIAITQRLDVFQLLEKRIQSRMFSRKLLFTNLSSERQLIEVMKERLSLTRQSFSIRLSQSFNDANSITDTYRDNGDDSGVSTAVIEHNAAIDQLFLDTTLRQHIHNHFEFGHSVQWFLTVLSLAVARIKDTHPVLYASDIVTAMRMMDGGSNVSRTVLLSDCTLFEWVVLVAVYSCTQSSHTGTTDGTNNSSVNLLIAYSQYQRFRYRNEDIPRIPKTLFHSLFFQLVHKQLLIYQRLTTQQSHRVTMLLPSYIERQYGNVSLGCYPSDIEALLSSKLASSNGTSDRNVPGYLKLLAKQVRE